MTTQQKVLTTVLWGLLVLVMVGVIGAGLWHHSDTELAADVHTGYVGASPAGRAAEGLPVLFDSPAFSLTDQDNRPATSADLKGKVWIADFVFTHCAGPCPLMTQKMVKLTRDIPAPQVHFVSFSVDPDHDTPDVLKTYAKDMNATDPRQEFLTGKQADIFAVAAGMNIVAKAAEADNPILHSERFLLVDSAGHVRNTYHSNDPDEMHQLVVDAATLAHESAAHAG